MSIRAVFALREERSEDCQGDLVLSYVITKTGDELGPLCIIRCILVSCRSFKRFLSLLQLMNGAGLSPASSQARYPGQCHPLLDIIDRYLHIIDTYIDRRYTSLSIIRQRKEALLFVAVR